MLQQAGGRLQCNSGAAATGHLSIMASQDALTPIHPGSRSPPVRQAMASGAVCGRCRGAAASAHDARGGAPGPGGHAPGPSCAALPATPWSAPTTPSLLPRPFCVWQVAPCNVSSPPQLRHLLCACCGRWGPAMCTLRRMRRPASTGPWLSEAEALLSVSPPPPAAEAIILMAPPQALPPPRQRLHSCYRPQRRALPPIQVHACSPTASDVIVAQCSSSTRATEQRHVRLCPDGARRAAPQRQ